MNKQAYAKMMGLNKKAQELIGPTITPESVKNRARKVEQKEGLARTRKNQAANAERSNIARNIDKEQAAYAAKQRAMQEAQAQARRLRQQKEQKERAQIAKGVDAAVEKYKQQQIQDRAALDALNKQRQRHQQITELVRQNNALKDRQANLKNLAMTDTQKAQARIAEQKLRNQTMKNFNRIFAQAKAKKQELQNKGTFANTLKAMGRPVPFAAPAATAVAKPQYGPTIEGAAKVKADREALQKYWDAEAAKQEAAKKVRLQGYNKKYGPVQNFIPNIIKNHPYSKLLQWTDKKDAQARAKNKAAIPGIMKAFLKGQREKQMGERTAQGANSVFDYANIQKGGIPEASRNAFLNNFSKYMNYDKRAWWDQLLEWFRHMWANVSGGNPLQTVRGAAFDARDKARNFYSNLSPKLQSKLQQSLK